MISMMHNNIFDMDWHQYICAYKKTTRSLRLICELPLVCYRSFFVCCLRCIAKSAVAGCAQSQNSTVVSVVQCTQLVCASLVFRFWIIQHLLKEENSPIKFTICAESAFT